MLFLLLHVEFLTGVFEVTKLNGEAHRPHLHDGFLLVNGLDGAAGAAAFHAHEVADLQVARFGLFKLRERCFVVNLLLQRDDGFLGLLPLETHLLGQRLGLLDVLFLPDFPHQFFHLTGVTCHGLQVLFLGLQLELLAAVFEVTVQLVVALHQLVQLVLRGGQVEQFVLDFLFLPLQINEQIVHGGLVLARALSGVGDYVFGQTAFLRNFESIATAGPPCLEHIGRGKVLLVEEHGAVEDARRLEGEHFQVGIVRRDDAVAFALIEFLQYRFRNSAPHLRVGAGAKFINEDKGFAIGVLQEFAHINQAAGIGREVVLQRLRVADVGEDVLENAHLADFVHRHQHPTLQHQLLQAHRFHQDGFAPGIGAGQDDDAVLAVQFQVEGHGFPSDFFIL